ncbi:hypothetical protein FANTH_12861 [Fusarium anthophilum]|uniref:RNase H type-1 domain-containing protein n=1 Tax=Fusarium anthophilum TaxID=48485 RepID=A0A8H4YRD7_9HYPO|nr:hypothetical protein FANTH_12861 [Fusarium anthophilum]
MASSSIAEIVRRGAANSVSFNTKKTEVMHFSRSKLRTAPAIRLILWRSERARLDHVLTTTSSNEDIRYRQRVTSGHAFDVQTNSLHPARGRNFVYRCFYQEQMPPLQTASKEKSADAFSHWVESLDPLTLVVYSDGSLSSEGAASYGFTIHQNNIPIFDGSGRLGPAEVFDAEATGALEGLKAALDLRESATQNIFICLDNLAAATCLRGTPSEFSQNVFLEFQALTTSHGAIQVRWVPGHSYVPGKEQADKLAKAASSLPEPEGAQPTLAYLRRIARQKPKEAFQAWWSTSAPEQYKRLNLKATTGCPPELPLPRAALHHLLAARSLHGDFAAYHERFDHVNARLICSCGRRKTPDHIFYCRKVPLRHRMRLSPSPNTAVNLAIERDFSKFIDLSKDSAFFGKICPRY